MDKGVAPHCWARGQRLLAALVVLALLTTTGATGFAEVRPAGQTVNNAQTATSPASADTGQAGNDTQATKDMSVVAQPQPADSTVGSAPQKDPGSEVPPGPLPARSTEAPPTDTAEPQPIP